LSPLPKHCINTPTSLQVKPMIRPARLVTSALLLNASPQGKCSSLQKWPTQPTHSTSTQYKYSLQARLISSEDPACSLTPQSVSSSVSINKQFW
jgi:hypothetical protein